MAHQLLVLSVYFLLIAFRSTDALRDDGDLHAEIAQTQHSSAGLPPVAQQGDNDCGPTCVRNVLRLSGADVSAEEVYDHFSAVREMESQPAYDGSTMTTMSENEQVLKEYGFDTKVCLNAYMQLEKLRDPKNYKKKAKPEAYVIWYVNEPEYDCNHFVVSSPVDTAQGNSTTDWCDTQACKKKFEALKQWVFFDPATREYKEDAATEDENEVVPPKTFDQFPAFGKELLQAYLQGHQYNPNKGTELFAAIIATKGLKRAITCAETSYGKDHELPQKEGCARAQLKSRF